MNVFVGTRQRPYLLRWRDYGYTLLFHLISVNNSHQNIFHLAPGICWLNFLIELIKSNWAGTYNLLAEDSQSLDQECQAYVLIGGR